METNEHILAGQDIRVASDLKNKYLHVSGKGAYAKLDEVNIVTVPDEKGIPRVTATKLSPGVIIAIAGDYKSLPGWGKKLNMPDSSAPIEEQREQVVLTPLTPNDRNLFQGAYTDLANTSQSTIDYILAFDKVSNTVTEKLMSVLPFMKSPIALASKLITQGYYALTVNNYFGKLDENEAHFALWATKAYMTAHTMALDYAELAVAFKNHDLSSERTRKIFEAAQQDEKFMSGLGEDVTEDMIFDELGQRYEALAVSTDLFGLHFYSDHFAGGHLRVGVLRESAPRLFGVWGSILVNTMHDLDNLNGVIVNNGYQPKDIDPNLKGKKAFNYPDSNDKAYGDGTYLNEANNGNSNELSNGMTNSLGDIYRVLNGEKRPSAAEFGGLPFLPTVNYNHCQLQPLLVQSPNGDIYYLKNYNNIGIIEPDEYKKLKEHPEQNPHYEKLTYFKAMALVFKLRGLSALPFIGSFFTPNVEQGAIEKLKEPNPETHQSSSGKMFAMMGKPDSNPADKPEREVVAEPNKPVESTLVAEKSTFEEDVDYRATVRCS